VNNLENIANPAVYVAIVVKYHVM